MAWVKEVEQNAIIDATLGALNNWDNTTFIWNEILDATYTRFWTRETKSASAWTKET